MQVGCWWSFSNESEQEFFGWCIARCYLGLLELSVSKSIWYLQCELVSFSCELVLVGVAVCEF